MTTIPCDDGTIPNLPGFAVTIIREENIKDGVDLHSYVLDFARQQFRKRRELPQIFFVFITRPTRALMVLSPQDPDYEGATTPPWVTTAVRHFARLGKANAIWCASEAWVAQNRDTDPHKDLPSSRDDRREVVMVTYECPMAQPPMQFWIAKIDRCARPKLLHWEPHHDAYSVDRLQYMLPREAYGQPAEA